MPGARPFEGVGPADQCPLGRFGQLAQMTMYADALLGAEHEIVSIPPEPKANVGAEGSRRDGTR